MDGPTSRTAGKASPQTPRPIGSQARPFLVPAIVTALLSAAAAAPPAAASEWLPSALVHADTPYPESATDVAVGPDGIPFVVWDLGDIWWVRWDRDCSCWSAPAIVNSNSLSDEYPRISIGSDGVPWVVWDQYQSSWQPPRWAMQCSRYVNGSWTSPQMVLTPTGAIFDIVALSEDEAWVVSETSRLGQEGIWVGHYESGAWVERGWFNGGEGYDSNPTVAVDDSGTVWVAWDYLDTASSTYVARLAGGQWTIEPTPLGGAGPQLAAVGDRVFIVWTVNDGEHGTNLAYRIWQDGWGEVGFVNEPDTTDTGDGAPSISGFGGMGPVIAWTAGPTFSGSYRDIIFSHWTGSGWSGEETISIPDSVVVAIDEYSEVALGPDGRAWASWKRQGPWPDNPDYDIWYAQGQVYSPTTAVGESAAPARAPLRILRSVPNPARGFSTTVFEVAEAGRYDAVVSDATGRVLERVSLGLLASGVYTGERAFRWPLRPGVNPKSGVYFIRFEDVSRKKTVASGKFVLLL